jgi:alkylation response protein AidB-like acyl-CoA dehydrogenase
VRVPAENLVGGPGRGWTIAKALLEHERAMISKLRDEHTEEQVSLEELARRYVGLDEQGRVADADLRDRLLRANMDFLANKLTLRRSAEAVRAGRGPGPETSMFKLYGTELNKRRKELAVLLAGYQGLGWEGEGFSPEELQRARMYLRARANSIEGGTSEIQLNIIAKRVLGLPD